MFGIKTKKSLLTWIIALVILLSLVGLVNQMSISIPRSLKETRGLKTTFFITKHFIFLIGGFTVIGIINKIVSIKLLKKLSPLIYILGAILLIATLFLGSKVNGAKRWIRFGFFNLQSSELVKISLIMIIARFIEFSYGNKKETREAYSYLAVLTAIYFLLILASKAFSSAVQIALIFLIMNWLNPFSEKYYSYITFLFSIILGIIGIIIEPYRISRLLGNNDHGILSIKSISNGFLFGTGSGNGIGRQFYLPEIQTDYAFAGFAEEWGFIGAIFLITLFIIFISLIFYSSKFIDTIFEKMVIIGIGIMITNQVILHLLINVNLLPSTGVPLPFISYGGSSMITLFISLGILVKIISNLDNNLESLEEN